MYFHHLNYVPIPIKVLDVTRMPLSIIEELDLSVSNSIVWINHNSLPIIDKCSVSETKKRDQYVNDIRESTDKIINNGADLQKDNSEKSRMYSDTNNYQGYGNKAYNVIGVQFDSFRSGCYYYYGDNNTYQINDRVLVPTGNNGNQVATVVFRKIYANKSDIPYGGNLKSVIRKL